MEKIDWKQQFTELHCSFDMAQQLGIILGLDPAAYTLSYNEQGELGDGAYIQELETSPHQTHYPALNLIEAMVLFYGVVPKEPEIFKDNSQYIVKCGCWESTGQTLVDAICAMYIQANRHLN